LRARSNRFVVMLTDDEIAAIDEFRFANRSKTMAGAVRTLIECGLAAKEKGPVGSAIPPGHRSSKSLEGNADEHGNR